MHKESSGFTLVELITVIVLVAILSVYAVARQPSSGAVNLLAQADLFTAHMQHIQALAMDWSQPLRLAITSGGYSVSCATVSATPPCDVSPVLDPTTNSPFIISLESGISLSGKAITDFDTLGRPVAGGSIITSSPARTFTLSIASIKQVVTLSPLTGFAAQ